MLIVTLMLSTALAENLNLNEMNRFAMDRGFDVAAFLKRLISGDSISSLIRLEAIPGMIKQNVLQSLSALALNLALPVAACVLLRMVTGAGDTSFMMNLLCALCCATALTRTWIAAQRQVTDLIDGILQATERITPAMASAAALTGGTFWSSAAGPLSNLCATLIQRMLKDWGLGLCRGAVVVALSGAVAGRYALNRLFELIKSVAHWLLGAAVFVYGALVSAQGIVSAAKDGAAMQTAKIAIENIVPIIGGGVSGAAGSLAVSAGLARSAIGITGVALIVRLCLKPMLKLGSEMLALKLISAAMEPLAEGAAAELIGHFGDVLEMLLAIVILSGVMAAMIPAGCAALAGGLLQ